MRQVYLFLLVLLFSIRLQAQVGINTTTPDTSSSLDIESTNSGVLIPRMTSAQRNAIITPAKGLLVFDNTRNSFWFYTGTNWQELIGRKTTIIDSDLDTQIQVEKTPDDDLIRFDIKGNERWRMTEGRLVPYNSNNNIAIGYESLLDNDIGSHNIANGYRSLNKNLYGSHNISNGYYSLYRNLVGSYNNAMGYEALAVNFDGNYNIANGYRSLYGNREGNHNIGIGTYALRNNYNGDNNVAVGRNTLTNNSLGNNNIAIGNQAGDNLTAGNNNTIIGGNSIDFPSTTASNQLNIGNIIYGKNINGTGTTISTGNIGIGIDNPNPDAVLDISSTNSGVLLPRIALIDTSSPTPLTTDVAGMLVYNTATIGNVTPGFYFNDGNDWIRVGQTQNVNWTLNGNSNSINGTHFIGTTNAQNLDIRTNNIIKHRFTQKGQFEFLNTGSSIFLGRNAGLNDDLSNNTNVFIGEESGSLNTNGSQNTAIGHQSLMNNALGQFNTAFGFRSLIQNTGNRNTGLGHLSLQENTTGYANTATGTESLQLNTTGNKNTASGYESLNFNTTGSFNTAFGNESLYRNDTGNNNTSVGKYGLRNSIDGSNNTAIGYNAGDNLTTGSNNTIIGGNSIGFPSATASNQLNIGNIIYGNNIEGTGTTVSTGNIGIGTDNPLRKLDINGEIAIREGNPGLGKVLTSDATGNASWENPANAIVGGFTHYIGESYLGGIIYYLYKGSDGLEHGLVVSLTETNLRWQWISTVINANRTEDGVYNTNLMIGSSPITDYLTTLGSGWYLPSIDELALLYFNRFLVQKALRVGGYSLLSFDMYWSSTEYINNNAMAFFFFFGEPQNRLKSNPEIVRGIKAF